MDNQEGKESLEFSLHENRPPFESIEAEKQHLRSLCLRIKEGLGIKALYLKGHGEEAVDYVNIPASFDIETTSFEIDGVKYGTMYAFVIGLWDDIVVGRTWEDYMEYLQIIREEFGLNERTYLPIYVHNLAFEFQFIRTKHEWRDVFSLDSRMPLRAKTVDGLEFRCSYRLSGYSLAKVGENLQKYKVKKLVGDLDYDLYRHYATKLTDTEWRYIFNDGLVVLAYIKEEMEKNKNKVTKIPMTKTGYVRREVRADCLYAGSAHHGDKTHKYGNYRKKIHALNMSPDEYRFVHQAFQGGFTHSNPLHTGGVYTDVSSYDFTSSYPAVMVMEKYPMGSGMKYHVKDLDDFRRKLKYYGCVFYIRFYDLEATLGYDYPISSSKLIKWDEESLDVFNGRVVSCKQCTMVITNIDFEIYSKFYKWSKIEIGTMWLYTMDYLPTDFVRSVLTMYQDKTQLKGVPEKYAEYMHSKENLNSCYGMCVTNIVRKEWKYSEEKGWHMEETMSPERQIQAYNDSKVRFLAYVWGIFITAYARRNLFTAIYAIGDDYIYSDTDSVKILNRKKHEKYFEDYNKRVEKKLHKACDYHHIDYAMVHPKTIKGVEKILGVWDYEGTYKEFKTLGAKRYIVEKSDGSLEITVSGVQKKAGADYLMLKYKTPEKAIDNFNSGLVFPDRYAVYKNKVYDDIRTAPKGSSFYEATGKYVYEYIDEPYTAKMTDYLGNTKMIHEDSSSNMTPASYSMSIAEDMIEMMKGYIYER